LLSPLDSAVAQAVVDVNLVQPGDVNHHKVFVRLPWVITAEPGWVTELDNQPEPLERPPLEKITVPLLSKPLSASAVRAVANAHLDPVHWQHSVSTDDASFAE
jgi:hypothetical protein